MKTVTLYLKTICSILIILASVNCFSQTNHSEIYSFMKSMGWQLTADNIFSSTRTVSCSEPHYYNFDSGHKYAIVAFTRSKDVKDINLQTLYKNGEVFSKKYDTYSLPKLFDLKDCAILTFNPQENISLGVKLVSSKISDYCDQCHYMIFYK